MANEGLIGGPPHFIAETNPGRWAHMSDAFHAGRLTGYEEVRAILRSDETRDALWDAVDDAIVVWAMDSVSAASLRRDVIVDAVLRVLVGEGAE